VLVNQDVTVQEGWLKAMLEALVPPEVVVVGRPGETERVRPS
jgi:hypothetical protein